MTKTRKLSDVTRKLLIKKYPVVPAGRRGVGLRELEKEVSMSLRWLYRFRGGYIDDPLASNLQELYEVLTGEPLLKIA